MDIMRRATRFWPRMYLQSEASAAIFRRWSIAPMKGRYRFKSTFSHISEKDSKPRMVDIGDKMPSRREASARSIIKVPATICRQLVSDGGELVSAKGPIFNTAIVAGVMAAKKTSDLIPFCHQVPLDKVDIDIVFDGESHVIVTCTAVTTHKTGVEMEALVGASAASLCVYDMCKALSHDICIKETKLLLKSGGKSLFVRKDGDVPLSPP